MKPLLLIIALLFSTPVNALIGGNKVCPYYVESFSDLSGVYDDIQRNKCDVINMQIDRKVSWARVISEFCDFNFEIVEDNAPARDVIISCVPKK